MLIKMHYLYKTLSRMMNKNKEMKMKENVMKWLNFKIKQFNDILTLMHYLTLCS